MCSPLLLQAAGVLPEVTAAALSAGVYSFFWLPELALHAFARGAAGGMVLAIMTRIALGDKGHPLRAARPIVSDLWAGFPGAISRVFGTLAFPSA